MDNQREKERDRSRRGDRPSRFSDAVRDRSNDRDRDEGRRLFVSNIPYEFRWTELKDLFKEKVGDVAYVELFNDENGKPRGCGVVEFTNSEAMKRALLVMHRFELNGRKLVLKEETGKERSRLNTARPAGVGGGHRNVRDDMDGWGSLSKPREPENFNTYGLSLQFLDSINVQPPLLKKVFVANLDYKVDRAKIKEIFKLAGKVRNIDLAVDKDGNSRGFAVVEYDHPVEAVQAISMFDKQMLFERRMTVRMDRGSSEKTELRLPEGLKGIGLGLGPNGEPLRDVARNLPQNTTANNLTLANTAASSLGSGMLGAMPNANVALNGLGAGLSTNSLHSNNTLGGSLGLQALNLTGLGALQNSLLQQNLTANDLATMLTQAQAANVNSAGLSLGNDLGSNVLSNSGLNSNVLVQSSGMGSGSLTGSSRQMGGGSVPGQGYGRDPVASQNSIKKSSNSDMVVISNLPPTVTWQLIREKFSECGDVKFAELTGSDTAIVRFYKEWDAERAIKMFDRTRIDGRTIDVRYF